MADNVTFQAANPATPPAGFKVATDEIDGVAFQRVKLDTGADGASLPVDADHPLPVSGTVTAQDGGGSLTVDGAVSLINEAGVAYGVKHIGNKPRVSAMPYLYDIAEGNVSGHDEFERFGYNADIDTAAPEDIWPTGGTFVNIASEAGLEILSSSANDAAGNTGIRTVILYYLTNTFVEKSEIITLNGTGVVPTVATDIYRVQSLRAATTGGTGAAVGTITLRNLADTPIYATIEPLNTRSRNIFYTVPMGKVLYITSMTVGCISTASNNGVLVTLRATYDHAIGANPGFFMPHAEIAIGSMTSFQRNFEVPIKFPAGVDISARASAIANNAQASVALRGWIETA
jgi:hypothetical protein